MFKQRPQSPESRSIDPRITRGTTVALAVGFLRAATEANQSREVAAIQVTPTLIDQQQVFTSPIATSTLSQEELLMQARVSAERARSAHGVYANPAEDMTDDFSDAQRMLRHEHAPAEFIPFPQQLEQHNPIIKRAA